jgi:hypothetical protein
MLCVTSGINIHGNDVRTTGNAYRLAAKAERRHAQNPRPKCYI